MDHTTSYVNLLNSQGPDSAGSAWCTSQGPNETVETVVKQRRIWSTKEDIILIGAWLNTSKDAIVSNEQKAVAFWKRIQDYYNASPQLVGTTPREFVQCKQRWGRINDQVCKFVGCFEAAMREQRSGQNDDDLMKRANEFFFNDYGYRFGLEHAWRELRHDKKWCSSLAGKETSKAKRKQVQELDGEAEASSHEVRPIGIKAAKAGIKRKNGGREGELSQIQAVMEMKGKLSKQKILDRLLSKKEPLSEMETSLKDKLMTEML